jgi:hypothetical protein
MRMQNEALATELVQRLEQPELLDFIGKARSAASTAAKSATDVGLTGAWRKRVTGMTHRGLCEDALDQVAKSMDATSFKGTVPGTEVKVYQQVHFVKGVLLGLASVPEPGELPVRNLTRSNLAQCINAHWEADLFGKRTAPPEIEVYALLLVCRDRKNLGDLQEVAIAVIAANYDKYLHYERLESFLRRYEPKEEPQPNVTPVMKKSVGTYVPPEIVRPEEKKKGS